MERLREGTWLGHVAEHVALQLQREAGGEQRRGKTRGAGRRGQYNVIYGYGDDQVGLVAGRLAVRLVNHLVEREPGFDFEAELERFILRAERTAFGPSTQAIVDEAVARDIPWLRLNEHSLVQLGQGVYQQRIRATMTSKTSSLAVDVAGDKELTTRLLAAAGLPVPRSYPVRDVEDALAAARRLGFPLVVKPLDGNHGRGVHLDLRTEEEVAAAFPDAQAEARRGTVLVETFVAGNDYRVLVVGGRMVAIAERVPAHVVGDGTSTVAQLVEQTNADPRRGVGHEKVLTRIRVDQAAVELVRDQGLRAGRRARRGRHGQADPDRQHVDRRHLHRPHRRGPPRQRGDRRGGGPGGRAGRGRDRLHRPRPGRAGARDGRGDRRGQRGPRLPHAHPPDRRRAPVRGQAGGGPPVPARHPGPHPDRRRDRHQRQDDHGPDDRPHLQGDGPPGRPDLDRRHPDRRAAGGHRRRLGAALGPDGAPEPAGRLRRVRGGQGRDPARGPRLRAQRRRGGPQHRRRPPRPARHRHPQAAGRGQAGGDRGRAPRRPRGPQRRRPAGRRDAPALLGRAGVLLHGGRQRAGRQPTAAGAGGPSCSRTAALARGSCSARAGARP